MAVKAVQRHQFSASLDAGEIVGEGGADAGAGFHHGRIGKGRVQRVGGVQQFHQRAGGDRACGFRLDHRRADHEEAVAARHDVDRDARMQQPNRPVEDYLVGPQIKHLAADAAQRSGLADARRAGAIDDMVKVLLLGVRADEENAACDQLVAQGSQRPARIEMGFAREEQRVPEATGQGGLERRDPLFVEPFVSRRAAGEAL